MIAFRLRSMPSGRTHDRITLWSLPVVVSGTLLLTRSPGMTLLVSSGFLFSGLLLGPDLDIHSVHFKRWGWFRWIWIPYRGSLTHRSPLSHAPITGTVVRVVYLLVWLAIAGFGTLTIINELAQLGWSWGDIGRVMTQSLSTYQTEWLSLAVGLELGALSHYMADWIVTVKRRSKTKGWRAILPPPSKPRRRASSSRSRKR